MYIVPLNSAITPLDILSQNKTPAEETVKTPSFTDVFKEVYEQTQETNRVLNQNAADIVMGNIDDLHTVYNNITKAQISLQTLVAVRDAAQQSYKEIMQMTV